MDLHTFVRSLLRYWWVVAATLVVVLAATAFFTLRQTPVYESSVTLLLRVDRGLGSVDHIVDAMRMLQSRGVIATYARFPASASVTERIRERLKLSASEMDDYKIRTRVLPDTDLLSITVGSSDPKRASEMAVIVAEETADYAKGLYRIFGLTVLDPPPERGSLARPRMLSNLATGTVAGIVLGLAFAFLVAGVEQFIDPSAKRGAEPGRG